MPVVRDSIAAKAEKNVFVVKDNKLLSSFYSGDLEFSYPYYSCMKSSSEKLSFFVEGLGTKAGIVPGCLQPECTAMPGNVSREEAEQALSEITGNIECSGWGESKSCCPYFSF